MKATSVYYASGDTAMRNGSFFRRDTAVSPYVARYVQGDYIEDVFFENLMKFVGDSLKQYSRAEARELLPDFCK